MEFNLDIRKKQLQSLNQYIRSSEDSVRAVFQSLGWTIQKTFQRDAKVVCPVNKNHLISYETSETHLKKCTLKSAGYDIDEAFLSEPLDKNDGSIKLTNAKKIEILTAAKGNKSEFKIAWNGRDLDPLTSDRLSSTFSTDERLALYDYSIKHTTAPPNPEEFTLILLILLARSINWSVMDKWLKHLLEDDIIPVARARKMSFIRTVRKF